MKETLSRVVDIDAETVDDAIETVEQEHEDEVIVLDYADYDGVEIKEFNEKEIDPEYIKNLEFGNKNFGNFITSLGVPLDDIATLEYSGTFPSIPLKESAKALVNAIDNNITRRWKDDLEDADDVVLYEEISDCLIKLKQLLT